MSRDLHDLMNQYVYFMDEFGIKRVGYVYKITDGEIEVHSKQLNRRGISKLYYYTFKKEDVLEIIDQKEAISHSIKMTD